jgi:hypothetical protein
MQPVLHVDRKLLPGPEAKSASIGLRASNSNAFDTIEALLRHPALVEIEVDFNGPVRARQGKLPVIVVVSREIDATNRVQLE